MTREEFLLSVSKSIDAIVAQCSAKRQPSDQLLTTILAIAKELGKCGDFEELAAKFKGLESYVSSLVDNKVKSIEDAMNKLRNDVTTALQRVESDIQFCKGRAGVRNIMPPKPGVGNGE